MILSPLVFKDKAGKDWFVFGYDLFFGMGLAFMSVAILTFTLEKLGGQPFTQLMKDWKKLFYLDSIGFVNMKFRDKDPYSKDTIILSDLIEKMKNAKNVKMLGIILYKDWFNNSNFKNMFREAIQEDKKRVFKFIFLKPFDSYPDQFANAKGSPILKRRIIDESLNSKSRLKDKAAKMNSEIRLGLNFLSEFATNNPEKRNTVLNVKLINKTYITCSIIIVDNLIYAIHYLHKSGADGSPVIIIENQNKKLFQIYNEEFETIWNSNPTYFIKDNIRIKS